MEDIRELGEGDSADGDWSILRQFLATLTLLIRFRLLHEKAS